MAKSQGSRSRSSSRSRSTAKKATPTSQRKPSKSPARSAKKTPSKSPARTPAKTPSKSPARKASSASISSVSSTGSKRLGRPPKATSTPKQTPKRSASVSSASRSASRGRAAREAAPPSSELRVRQHAVSATPRVASPRRGNNGTESIGCKYNNAICNFAKESWAGFKDGIMFKKYLSRRDKERRNRVWKTIFFIAFIAFVYYTYYYKFGYYKQAYGYAQGYMDAARDFVAKKTK